MALADPCQSVVESSATRQLSSTQAAARPVTRAQPAPRDDARLAQLFHRYYDFAWRSLRRLGVDDGDLDDAAQEVFWVVSRRLSDIREGRERAFVFGTALRVASDARRSSRRRKPAGTDDDVDSLADTAPGPGDCIDQKRARAILSDILARMPDDLRIVFVLFELEGLTMKAIADDLNLPAGTVASRLRRARQTFQSDVSRLRARDQRMASER